MREQDKQAHDALNPYLEYDVRLSEKGILYNRCKYHGFKEGFEKGVAYMKGEQEKVENQTELPPKPWWLWIGATVKTLKGLIAVVVDIYPGKDIWIADILIDGMKHPNAYNLNSWEPITNLAVTYAPEDAVEVDIDEEGMCYYFDKAEILLDRYVFFWEACPEHLKGVEELPLPKIKP